MWKSCLRIQQYVNCGTEDIIIYNHFPKTAPKFHCFPETNITTRWLSVANKDLQIYTDLTFFTAVHTYYLVTGQ